MHKHFEYLSIVLIRHTENIKVLLEDQYKLFCCYSFKDERLRKSINEELLRVCFEREKLSEGLYLSEEKEAIFVITLAAISQNFKAQVDYLSDLDRINFDSFSLADHLRCESLDNFEGSFDFEDIFDLTIDMSF